MHETPAKPLFFFHHNHVPWRCGAGVGGGGESVKLRVKRRQKLELHLLLQGETDEEQELPKCQQAFESKLNRGFLGSRLEGVCCWQPGAVPSPELMVVNF